MKNSRHFIILFLCFVSSTSAFSQLKQAFSFSLSESANTSAGVFKSDGTLVRTLWSGINYSKGIHAAIWDGLQNDSTTAPANTYHVEVLSSNLTYTWQGAAIGNTSTNLTGSDLYHTNEQASDIFITGNTLLYATGYQEQDNTQLRTELDNIGSSKHVMNRDVGYGGGNQVTFFVAADNKNAYWGGFYTDGQSFVFATKLSDNSLVTFPSGTNIVDNFGQGSERPHSALAVLPPGGEFITGLALQKTGNYIFVARPSTLQVCNKTTGATVRTISVKNTGRLAIDATDKLWMAQENNISQYTINSDGTITPTGISISGVSKIGAIAISPDNSKVAVADVEATQQVVKFYNASTGRYINALGTPGGYLTNANVNDNKFYFYDPLPKGVPSVPEYMTGIAYQADGSFWVSDAGNCRMQHYSSSNAFINRIQYVPKAFVVEVDETDSTKVFEGYREYQVDYTSDIQHCWTLKNNWGGVLSDPKHDDFRKMTNIVTVQGHTYGTLWRSIAGQVAGLPDVAVYELVPNGVARLTNAVFDKITGIEADGSKVQYMWDYKPKQEIRKYPLTGIDANGNLVWSSSYTVLASIPNEAGSPFNFDKVPNKITANGNFIFYNPVITNHSDGNEYHLGAVKDGKWMWKTHKGTLNSYFGDYPESGEFDNGNVAQYGGGFYAVKDKYVITSYHGEFWKGGQTNFFNLFYQNGLLLNIFGTSNSDAQLGEGLAEYAGNVQTGGLVKVGNDLYLYHGDESKHSSVHRWKIGGLETIKVQQCAFDTIPLILSYTDLLVGTQIGGNLLSYPGWTASHVAEANWGYSLGGQTPNKLMQPDLYMQFYQTNAERYIDRSLGNNTSLTSWSIQSQINFQNAASPLAIDRTQLIEVLDYADKVIARFYPYERDNSHYFFYGNDKTVCSGDENYFLSRVYKFRDFKISVNGSAITFTYDGNSQTTTALVDATANIHNPAKLRFRFITANGGNDGRAISVRNLRFYKNSLPIYRSKTSGLWNNTSTWQTTTDNITWTNAAKAPTADSANTITIMNGHTVTIDSTVTVDQVVINDSGSLHVAPNAAIIVNDGDGDDITIAPTGSLVIKSDSTGTGRIGNSDGTINGDVTVERFIRSSKNTSYRLLASSVNTIGSTKPFIRDNWQEGQNNRSINVNSNTLPACGTHISGSKTGASGFDATLTGDASLLTWNAQAQGQIWNPIDNTNSTTLDGKKGYLLFVGGDRSINLNIDTPNTAVNTTLRATGKVLTGTQNFTNLEGDSRYSLVTNPYASPIDWKSIYNDVTTYNATNFENYFTYWDPTIGTNGGYVTVNSNGIKSAPANATTEIQSGEAFFLKAKKGVDMPTFTVKEAHKSGTNNLNIFRTGSPEQLTTSLFYTAKDNTRKMADGVTVVYNNDYSAAVDENDAEEQANWNENFAIAREGKMLSIEGRPLIDVSDTLPLSIERLKQQNYEWQFDPAAFTNTNLQAYLDDSYLHTQTAISLSATTVIPFNVSSDTASGSRYRFRILFGPANILPVTITSFKAYKKQSAVEVSWSTVTESNIVKYEVEKSTDGNSFKTVASVLSKISSTSANSYTWTDLSPASGTSYYRLKIISANGTFEYSKVAAVTTDNSSDILSIFPNPVEGSVFNLKLNMAKGTYYATLLNLIGQEIFKKKIEYVGGVSVQQMQVSSTLTPGIYQLKLDSGTTTVVQQLIKK